MERKLKFDIFILTHNNPNNCRTIESLKSANYTGHISLVVDDEDPSLDKYFELGYDIYVFNKLDYLKKIDVGSSKVNPQLTSAVYARNAVEDIAKNKDIDYFIVMDDDLLGFRYRYIKDNKLCSQPVENFDAVIDNYIEFMRVSNSICVSFATDSSFIGGLDVITSGKILEKRACFTVYFRRTDKPMKWRFTSHEDYITSLIYCNIGEVMFTLPFVQRNISGMGDRKDESGNKNMYENTTDFQTAFYNVIACPWACGIMEYKNHVVVRTDKNTAYPKIISDKYRR